MSFLFEFIHSQSKVTGLSYLQAEGKCSFVVSMVVCVCVCVWVCVCVGVCVCVCVVCVVCVCDVCVCVCVKLPVRSYLQAEVGVCFGWFPMVLCDCVNVCVGP